jgi:hypothetical protein
MSEQKHDNPERQPLPPAPADDAFPDPLLPSRAHRTCFYMIASADRYGNALSFCALNALVFARLTARNGHSAVRHVQDNGIQGRAFAVGLPAFRAFPALRSARQRLPYRPYRVQFHSFPLSVSATVRQCESSLVGYLVSRSLRQPRKDGVGSFR